MIVLNAQMRVAVLGLFLLALLPFESCDLLGFLRFSVDVPLGSTFQLSIGQTARLKSEDLAITFRDVLEDSRCPVDVQCVWAGHAKVALELSQSGKARQTVELSSNLEPREAIYEGFRVRFEGLLPQPRSHQPIRRGDYRLSLSVSK
jgi:hypothetical protein